MQVTDLPFKWRYSPTRGKTLSFPYISPRSDSQPHVSLGKFTYALTWILSPLNFARHRRGVAVQIRVAACLCGRKRKRAAATCLVNLHEHFLFRPVGNRPETCVTSESHEESRREKGFGRVIVEFVCSRAARVKWQN